MSPDDQIETENLSPLDRFRQHLDFVLMRPGMYGVFHVEGLQLLIQGYQMGMLDDRVVFEFMNSFNDFVEKHFKKVYGIKGGMGWAPLIRFHSSGGDFKSIELFQKLYLQFLSKPAIY